MVVVSGIRISLNADNSAALDAALAKLGISQNAVADWYLYRESCDARHGTVTRVCSVALALADTVDEAQLCARYDNVRPLLQAEFKPVLGTERLNNRPVIAGFGPAGLFAAYLLAQYGYRPLVLERGGDMDSRTKKVETFFEDGTLDEQTNIQFGEGGAGTFSDGKLTTRINDPLCRFVLEAFAEHGAPQDILYKAKPHIGTDHLRGVIKSMRQAILENGGEVLFDTALDDIRSGNGQVEAAVFKQQVQQADVLILACGHSARDTFLMLQNKNLELTAKAFSVGLRIEHLQQDIDRALYGTLAGHPRLPKGEYALSAKVDGRGAYTFCMCPGGVVVPAASEQGGVVTNGMSNHARGGKNANSALVVSVDAKDFKDPFSAIAFQQQLERLAYRAGGGNFCAPAQDMDSFLAGKAGLKTGKVIPSYARGVTGSDFTTLLSPQIIRCLQQGAASFGRKIKGFDSADAILTGLETRTSSPLRIERDQETRQALGMQGLYPCGEGAGYAGGIMSAAVDGLKTALAVMARYCPD